MNIVKPRNAYLNSLIKSLSQKEQAQKKDLRTKVILKTMRKRHKRPTKKQTINDAEEPKITSLEEASPSTEVPPKVPKHGCNIAGISLPVLFCSTLMVLGCVMGVFL